jgi:hypothetical protein
MMAPVGSSTRTTAAVPLRATLTPFAQALADVMGREADGLTLRVISAADAVDPMRRVLKRVGLEEKKRVGYADGSRGVSWCEEPSLYIKNWVNSESAILLKEDAAGPMELSFETRTAVDTMRVVYRIGEGAGGYVTKLRGLWDVGIRKCVWEYHTDRTPPRYVERAQARFSAIKGCRLDYAPRGEGFVDYILTIGARP